VTLKPIVSMAASVAAAGGAPAVKTSTDVVEIAAVFVLGVDDHVQHDGRAAEMGHALIGDGVVDRLRGDVAAADGRAAHGGHGPVWHQLLQ
jgi:hypothetical protein